MPSTRAESKKLPTPKKLSSSIKRDRVHPEDYLKFVGRFSCEDCSHFKASSKECTIGYKPQWHLKNFQDQEYFLTGQIAFCRFLEID